MKSNIYCVGGSCVDIKLKAHAAIHLHTKNPVKASISYGGVARNVAENFTRLKMSVHLVSVLGDDYLKDLLIDHCKTSGMQTDGLISLPQQITATYYPVLTNKGELYIALSNTDIFDAVTPNTFQWHSTELDNIEFVFADTNFSHEVLLSLAHFCHKNNLKLCIDPTSVAKAQKLKELFSYIYLLTPNIEEAQSMTGITIKTVDDAFKAGAELHMMGVENVIITMADQGCVMVNKDTKFHVPAYKAQEIIDVTGAGDAFVAGVIYSLQKKYGLLKACKLGSALATLTIGSSETVLSNLTETKLMKYLTLQDKHHEI